MCTELFSFFFLFFFVVPLDLVLVDFERCFECILIIFFSLILFVSRWLFLYEYSIVCVCLCGSVPFLFATTQFSKCNQIVPYYWIMVELKQQSKTHFSLDLESDRFTHIHTHTPLDMSNNILSKKTKATASTTCFV